MVAPEEPDHHINMGHALKKLNRVVSVGATRHVDVANSAAMNRLW